MGQCRHLRHLLTDIAARDSVPPRFFLYAMSLLSPLIGLLILNSHRCRELRHKMVEIRQKREGIILTLNKQGRWKGR